MIALCNHIGASKLLETSLFSSAFENTSASDVVRVIHFKLQQRSESFLITSLLIYYKVKGSVLIIYVQMKQGIVLVIQSVI